jgi:hypothetical protein
MKSERLSALFDKKINFGKYIWKNFPNTCIYPSFSKTLKKKRGFRLF